MTQAEERAKKAIGRAITRWTKTPLSRSRWAIMEASKHAPGTEIATVRGLPAQLAESADAAGITYKSRAELLGAVCSAGEAIKWVPELAIRAYAMTEIDRRMGPEPTAERIQAVAFFRTTQGGRADTEHIVEERLAAECKRCAPSEDAVRYEVGIALAGLVEWSLTGVKPWN